jgi:hypothetical protein
MEMVVKITEYKLITENSEIKFILLIFLNSNFRKNLKTITDNFHEDLQRFCLHHKCK